jgi:hypothetical protein
MNFSVVWEHLETSMNVFKSFRKRENSKWEVRDEKLGIKTKFGGAKMKNFVIKLINILTQ